MHRLRRLFLNHRALAVALVALALAMKIVVPAGFMPNFASGHMVISLCTGTGPAKMLVAVPETEHGKKGGDQRDQADQPCAFSGLSAPALGGADPILLALALLLVMALALRSPPRALVAAHPHLRPPLRGPPLGRTRIG